VALGTMAAAIAELLDCKGPKFDSHWGPLFGAAVAFHAVGASPLQAPQNLLDLANRTLQRWRPRVADIVRRLPDALMGRVPSSVLSGFCMHGYATALFWECFDVAMAAPALGVAACLRSLVSGPIDSQQWGPLEFSQSARWPVKVLDVRLLIEHWAACGDRGAAVADCPDVSAFELRAGLCLVDGASRCSGSLDPLTASTAAVARQLAAPGLVSPVTLRGLSGPLRLVVVGSHLGSNMEPLALVTACMRKASLDVDAVVYGTMYPFPGLICELFGHCAHNSHIDEIVGLLVQQMYRPHWEPGVLMASLRTALHGDMALRAAELFVCAQPMAICSLMRPLTDVPMLIYQAFPLIGATPTTHQHMLLAHFREMVRMPERSVFVAYSEFLALQFEYQLGRRPLCVRPHSLYATPTGGGDYNPDRENPRLLVSRAAGWARDSAAALVHFVESFAERDLRPATRLRFVFLGCIREPSDTVAGLEQPFGYTELRRYRGAVFFPWDMGMLLFSELYAIGVPLLVPDRSWMAAIVKRMVEYTDFGWWQLRDVSAVTMSPCGGPGSECDQSHTFPWVDANASIAHILRLYGSTDFVRWPHVEGFGSLPELMTRLLRLDFDLTSRKMQLWNKAALWHSLDIVGRALGVLLGGTGPPPQVGASSCV